MWRPWEWETDGSYGLLRERGLGHDTRALLEAAYALYAATLWEPFIAVMTHIAERHVLDDEERAFFQEIQHGALRYGADLPLYKIRALQPLSWEATRGAMAAHHLRRKLRKRLQRVPAALPPNVLRFREAGDA